MQSWELFIFTDSAGMRGNINLMFEIKEKRMTKITYEEIMALARISKIKIDREEAKQLVSEVEAVLEYASSLREVAKLDRLGVEKARTVNVMREDEVSPLDGEILLGQAPEREDAFFVVPSIIRNK